MADRLFLQGRVVSRYYITAMLEMRKRIASKGYRLIPGARVKPSPVQPWPGGLIWWDYYVEVAEAVSDAGSGTNIHTPSHGTAG